MLDSGGYFAMGGYGAYVWGAYGIAAIVIGGFAISSWRRLRHAIRAEGHETVRRPK